MFFIINSAFLLMVLNVDVSVASDYKDSFCKLRRENSRAEKTLVNVVEWGALRFLSRQDVFNLRGVSRETYNCVNSIFNSQIKRDKFKSQYFFSRSMLGNWLPLKVSVEILLKNANAIVEGGGEKTLERLHELHTKFARYGFSDYISTEDRNEQVADVLIQYFVWRAIKYRVMSQVWRYENTLGQLHAQVEEQMWNQTGEQVCDQLWLQVWHQVWNQIGADISDLVNNCVLGGMRKVMGLKGLVGDISTQGFRVNILDLVSCEGEELQKTWGKVITYYFMMYQYAVRKFSLSPNLRKSVAKMIAKYNINNIDFKKLMKILDDGIELATQYNNPVLVTQLETFKHVLPKTPLIN